MTENCSTEFSLNHQIDFIGKYSAAVQNMRLSAIRELLKVTSRSDIISLAGGFPDPKLLPIKFMEKIAAYVLSDQELAAHAMQYGITEGEQRLRKQLLKLHSREGINDIGNDNIQILTSSQQGLSLIGKILLNPFDIVIVELPSYIGALQAFKSYGAVFEGVPMDEFGIDADLLRKTLEKMRDEERCPKFLYLIPDFQNPTGVTMSLGRRRAVLDICAEFGLIILEDSPYGEIRFENKPVPSLLSLDTFGCVISVRTFSKIAAPGLRTGWATARLGAARIIKKLTLAKQSADICTSPLNQLMCAEFIKFGFLDYHLTHIRHEYRKKRDAMLHALNEHMPAEKGIGWTRPDGGFFLWLTLPKNMNADELLLEAVQKGVAFVPGSNFYYNGGKHDTARLNFSYPSITKIHEGIRRLAAVIKEQLAK